MSLNTNGLGDFKKRSEVFKWLHKYADASIIMLQETHSTNTQESKWRSQWGFETFFAHGESNARGVCILFKNTFDFEIHDKIIDPGGRYIILDITIRGIRLTLGNIYGPNRDDSLFFQEIINVIEGIPNDNRIIGGDYNLVLDLEKDKKGKADTKFNAQKIILAWMDETDLTDIWRHQHPDSRKYTWHGKRGRPLQLVFSRIDFILVSFGMAGRISSSVIKPGFKSDHSYTKITLDTSTNVRGPGYWKLNTTLLKDLDYVTNIKHTITEVIYNNQNANNLVLWETIKCCIRGESIRYSSLKKRNRQQGMKNLQDTLEKLLDIQSADNSPENIQKKINIVKSKIEDHIEIKTQGSIIRSRIEWYEEGEKSSRYFLRSALYL